MTTMNISLPESMKAYVETQASIGEFTTSEYFRHLVRKDQEENEIKRRAQIAQYLALCEEQIARGMVSEWNYDAFLAEVEPSKPKKPRKGKRS